jgi:N-acetylmuramoyl-L-alanine amidase
MGFDHRSKHGHGRIAVDIPETKTTERMITKTLIIWLLLAVVRASAETPIPEDGGNFWDFRGKPNFTNPEYEKLYSCKTYEELREMKMKIVDGEVLEGKKLTWSMNVVPNVTPAAIRGEWTDSTTHNDYFEASANYGAYGFAGTGPQPAQTGATTEIDVNGECAIRINMPPIGFNSRRVRIAVEDFQGDPARVADMEVPAVVVIDPGHGDFDSGAIGRTDNTILEKDLALAYGLKLRLDVIDKFEDEERFYQVVMTRTTTGEYLDNSLRAELARDKGVDVFLSIHFNSATRIDARGTEYVSLSPSLQVNAAEDDLLGRTVQATTLAAVRESDAAGVHRDPKFGSYFALKDTSYGNTANYHPIRGVIIEVEFLSHEIALETVKLLSATGEAIKNKFAADVANNIFNNILNQP